MIWFYKKCQSYINTLDRLSRQIVQNEAEMSNIARISADDIRKAVDGLDNTITLLRRFQRNYKEEE